MDVQSISLRTLFDRQKASFCEQVAKAASCDRVIRLAEELFERLQRDFSTQRESMAARKLATRALNAGLIALVGGITAVQAEVRYTRLPNTAPNQKDPAIFWAVLVRVSQLLLTIALAILLTIQHTVGAYVALVLFGVLVVLDVVRGCLGISVSAIGSYLSGQLKTTFNSWLGSLLPRWMRSSSVTPEVVRSEATTFQQIKPDSFMDTLSRLFMEIDLQVTDFEAKFQEKGDSREDLSPSMSKWLQRLIGARRLKNEDRCRLLIEDDLDDILDALGLEARDYNQQTSSSEDFRLEASSTTTHQVTVLPALYQRGKGRLLAGLVSVPVK